MSKFDERLDKILVKFYNSATVDVHSENNHDGRVYTYADAEAKKAIKDLILEEVIDEDEPEAENGLLPDRVDRRNQLRAEQRKIITGGDDE